MAIAPLAAQTDAAPDLWAPAAPATPTAPDNAPPPPLPTPSVPATLVTPNPPQVSAATVVSDSSQSANSSALSSGGGLTPTGPGASAIDLGSQITSASLNRKLPFRITATLAEVYNNNIFSRPQKDGDFITRIGASGEYQIGDLHAPDGNYFDLIYAPSGHIYERHSEESGIDQYVDAIYGHHWSKLTLTLEQNYSETQVSDATVGGLATEDVYRTVAKATYVYSPTIDIVATARQILTNYDDPAYSDTKEWVGGIYALYHIDPKISVGFGPNFGYLNLETAPNETYQQFLARVIYDPYDNMHFEGTAGAEDREYQSYQRSDTLEPIFEFLGIYRPTVSSVITVNASRVFRPSYNVLGQDYIATNAYLTASQRFFQAYSLALAAGFENDDYQNVIPSPLATREDNYFFLQPSLTWNANGWLKVSAFDRYEEDNSNFDIFTYDTNQVGVSISATY